MKGTPYVSFLKLSSHTWGIRVCMLSHHQRAKFLFKLRSGNTHFFFICQPNTKKVYGQKQLNRANSNQEKTKVRPPTSTPPTPTHNIITHHQTDMCTNKKVTVEDTDRLKLGLVILLPLWYDSLHTVGYII